MRSQFSGNLEPNYLIWAFGPKSVVLRYFVSNMIVWTYFSAHWKRNLILRTMTIKAIYTYQNVSVGMRTVAPFTLYHFHTKTA